MGIDDGIGQRGVLCITLGCPYVHRVAASEGGGGNQIAGDTPVVGTRHAGRNDFVFRKLRLRARCREKKEGQEKVFHDKKH